ncbi:hypothetical protein DFH06DRAFT_1331888 [Mycena polygramma]|nr:hypothetical protein DFH06DRAFT_1331888 [Mycena polygramma]
MSLPDEIISEILSPALAISDDLFSDLKYVPFCKILTVHLCVVVLRSRSQADALEKVLQKNPEFGRFIKKLRIEGGYGMAIHTVLKCSSNITDIFLSLAIWSSDSTKGLCKGLPLVNPRRVLLVDPKIPKALKNQNLAALTAVILHCIGQWDNLLSAFYYVDATEWMVRASHLAEALAQSQTIHTVLLSQLFDVPSFLVRLSSIPSVRVLQLKVSPAPHVKDILDLDPRLKALVRYPAPEPSEDPAQIPISHRL